MYRVRTVREGSHRAGQLQYARRTACRRTALSGGRNEQVNEQSEGQGAYKKIQAQQRPSLNASASYSSGRDVANRGRASDALILLTQSAVQDSQIRPESQSMGLDTTAYDHVLHHAAKNICLLI